MTKRLTFFGAALILGANSTTVAHAFHPNLVAHHHMQHYMMQCGQHHQMMQHVLQYHQTMQHVHQHRQMIQMVQQHHQMMQMIQQHQHMTHANQMVQWHQQRQQMLTTQNIRSQDMHCTCQFLRQQPAPGRTPPTFTQQFNLSVSSPAQSLSTSIRQGGNDRSFPVSLSSTPVSRTSFVNGPQRSVAIPSGGPILAEFLTPRATCSTPGWCSQPGPQVSQGLFFPSFTSVSTPAREKEGPVAFDRSLTREKPALSSAIPAKKSAPSEPRVTTIRGAQPLQMAVAGSPASTRAEQAPSEKSSIRIVSAGLAMPAW